MIAIQNCFHPGTTYGRAYESWQGQNWENDAQGRHDPTGTGPSVLAPFMTLLGTSDTPEPS